MKIKDLKINGEIHLALWVILDDGETVPVGEITIDLSDEDEE